MSKLKMSYMTRWDYHKCWGFILNRKKLQAVDVLEDYVSDSTCSDLRQKINKYEEENEWALSLIKNGKKAVEVDPKRAARLIELGTEISENMNEILTDFFNKGLL